MRRVQKHVHPTLVSDCVRNLIHVPNYTTDVAKKILALY